MREYKQIVEDLRGHLLEVPLSLLKESADAIERLVKERDELQEQVYLLKPNRKISEYQAAMFAEMEIENKRLQAQLPAWISVEERLPDVDENVLVYNSESGDMDMAYYNGNAWVLQDLYEIEYLHPTHWMPLPDAPEVEG